MLSWAARSRRAGALVVGLLFGLLFAGLVLWFYGQAAREAALRHAFLQELDLPPEAFRLERVAEGRLRIAARNLALLDEAGDTILAAPLARFSLAADALEGVGPIVLDDVELRNPYLRLVELPTGEWNIQRALRVTIDDAPVAPEEDRPIVLADVRITRGRALLATPWLTEEPGIGAEDLRLTVLYGQPYRVRAAHSLEARLPQIRVGGPEGWRADIAELSAVLTDPDLRIARLRGTVAEVPDGFGFEIETLQTDRSLLAGAGRVRTVADQMLLDLRVDADPVDFGDLRWVSAMFPREGWARGELVAQTRPDTRTLWALREAEVVALESRVTGRLAMVTGADLPVTFLDTDLLLDPLDLRLFEAFGLGEQVPYRGQVRGRVATAELEAVEGPLSLDLVATVTPRDLPEVPASTIRAEGTLALEADVGARFTELHVAAEPLHLAALRPLLPEQDEFLRGMVRGSLLVSGTPADLRFADGDLLYEVGTAPPTRLVGVTGFVTQEPVLNYEITALAQPLMLGTVAEFAPAFPFHQTAFTGPVEIVGDQEALRFTLNLRGEVGGFFAQGTYAFTDPAAFRVAGRLEGLQPARLLREEIPLAGPVHGPFLVEGTTRDFRFDVDFTQVTGHFALVGRVQLPEEIPPIFEAEGHVGEFRIGTLIGRTGLFASPLTGAVRVAGGGLQAYVFELDLSGIEAVLEVEGWYNPLEVPEYSAAGRVAGLNLRLLPGFEQLPPTNLVAGFSVQGEGTTLQTFAGQLALDATRSLVGGMPLHSAVARLEVRNGLLLVDTLQAALANAQFAATGAWGLTVPAPEPLSFSLSSPNLAALTPILRSMQVIEPQLTGAITVQGTVAGTIENPVLDIEGSGRNLRYDGWRAGNLVFDVDAALTEQGWAGQGTVFADNVVLQDTEQFEAIRLEAVGSPARVGVGLVARRDRLTEASLSGTLELADQVPVGVQLQALSLRLDRSLWQLQRPTVVRWGELTGIQVDSLVLERTGPEEGLIAVDGQIPPVGELDFRVHARNVDVAEFRRLMPTAPPVRGVLTLDASMEGPRTAPELLVQARVDGFQYLDAAAEMLALNARYAAGATVANAAVWQDGVAVASAEGTVPMQVVFENLLPQVELLDDQLVAARVVADSLPLSLVAALVPYVSNGAGVLAADFSISGLLGSPQLSGAGRLSRGAVTLDELNVRFDAIEGDFTLQDQTIEIESLTARSLGGASVTGRITVDDRTRPLFELSGSFNQFRGINRADVATILVSGTVDLVGRYPTPSLTGRVELTGGNITLPPMEDRQAFDIAAFDLTEVIGDPLVTDPLEPTFVEQIVIQNLEVVVGDAVWAVSPQMRVQIAGDMLVSRFGPEQWQIFGDLQARRGSYTLTVGPIVREFDIVSGRIEFFGTPDLNPSLDILAQHRIRATGPGATGILNILVNVTGTAQFPRIALSSDTQPPLPESEILSYLIFGRPTFALGEVGGTLAQQLLLQEALGGLLAAQVEQLIRQAGLPFDYIRLRGRPSPTEFHDPLGTTTLEVGWQLAPNVFWTVEWGVGVLFGNEVGDTWGTSLEWQIDPQWSTRLAWEPLRRDRLLQQRIAATTQLTRQFSLELRRRWEYGISPELPQITEIAGDGDPPEPLPVSPGGSSPDSPPE
jgi:hypothetical protein